ncbi:hypothetical protein OG417_07895 [Actinoallomurus sp. NBC_01490]|uniref:hypothetical protein n=1 Tax=Actinoallomurus sp. NBC_01490 TaxID=2903557 RepID=UPI002E352C7A|nr:hypothetical protein [Actinoallomurus sp. NBC_01490]
MSLPLTLGVAACVLTLVPDTAASAAPHKRPTYTCKTVRHLKFIIYPVTVRGTECQASNGAPTAGWVNGPFKLASSTNAWVCRAGEVDPDLTGGINVLGSDCRLVSVAGAKENSSNRAADPLLRAVAAAERDDLNHASVPVDHAPAHGRQRT